MLTIAFENKASFQFSFWRITVMEISCYTLVVPLIVIQRYRSEHLFQVLMKQNLLFSVLSLGRIQQAKQISVSEVLLCSYLLCFHFSLSFIKTWSSKCWVFKKCYFGVFCFSSIAYSPFLFPFISSVKTELCLLLLQYYKFYYTYHHSCIILIIAVLLPS